MRKIKSTNYELLEKNSILRGRIASLKSGIKVLATAMTICGVIAIGCLIYIIF